MLNGFGVCTDRGLTAVTVVLLRGQCRQCVPFLSHYEHILYVCEQLCPYLLLGAEGESMSVHVFPKGVGEPGETKHSMGK